MTAQKHKKILVTGGTGFVGSYLLRYLLKEGYTNIRAGRRAESSMDLVESVKDKVEWVDCDILNMDELEDAMQDVQLVYHCAALVSYNSGDRDKLFKINHEGTENVVNAALFAGVERLLHVSSVAVIGRDPKGKLITEKTKWERGEMITNYAKSKYLGEMEAWRGWAEGLDVVVVNPASILGSGHWDRGTSKFFELAWQSFAWYAGGSAGFVDVRDVAKLTIKAMEEAESGERFILSAQNLSYKALMEQIALELGTTPARRKLQDWMQGLIWRWEGFVAWLNQSRPSVTREMVKRVTTSYAFDNTKSIETFKYSYQAISDTIISVADQFREAADDNYSSRVLPLV